MLQYGGQGTIIKVEIIVVYSLEFIIEVEKGAPV